MNNRLYPRNMGRDILAPSHSPHNPCTASGFTLLEVLVVVAVIALLVAILLPSLAKAREQSRRTLCLSNLRQIAVAWHQYLDANRDRFFQSVNANYNYGGIQGAGGPPFGSDPSSPVPKPLNSYLKLPVVTRADADVFFCPADDGGEIERPTVWSYYGTSYTTNPLLIGQNQVNIEAVDPCRSMWTKVNRRLKALSRSSVSNESRLLLIGDFGWVHQHNLFSPLRVEWHSRALHHDLAFMDGHAEFVHIRKGMHVTERYTIMPFRDLVPVASGCQQEVLP